ncbi:MAG TPA: hypothetical protein VF657_06170 [Actinoplanes sp.]
MADHVLVLYAAGARTVMELAEELSRVSVCRVLEFALAARRQPAVFWC